MPLRRPRWTLFLLSSLAVMLLAVGCRTPLPPQPPQVGPISVQPGTRLTTGETATLIIDASGTSLQFEWSALRGEVSGTGASVLYKAPNTPGPDTVTVKVTGAGEATVMRNLSIQVEPPTPTLTPTSSPTPTVPTATPTNTATPTPTMAPTDTPTPSPTPTPASITIDTMDSISGWNPYTDGGDSSVTVSSVAGRTDNAIEISFDLKEGGWVGISKELDSEVLSALPGAERIRFFYTGSDAPNTIELKLLTQPDDNEESAVFSVSWSNATAADGWRFLEAPISKFACWAETGCRHDEIFDLKNLWKIDFAISNKSRDTPGRGTVIIDDIQGSR
jgi:hypothetical protein